MQRITYTHFDKSTWGEGPWLNEPDKVQWMSETGFPCLIVRNHMGVWCGYVGVPREHKAFGKDYDSIEVMVHGGLTFASLCQTDGPEHRGVCHLVEEGENDIVWWLGFDCNHFQDLIPNVPFFEGHKVCGDYYRNQTFVTLEVESLAKQLKDML